MVMNSIGNYYLICCVQNIPYEIIFSGTQTIE